MLGTYSLEELLKASQMLFTARQKLTTEEKELATAHKELMIKQWDNNLHLSVLEAIFTEKSSFTFPIPPDDILDELKKRNPELKFAPADEPGESSKINELNVSILANSQ